LTEYSPPGRIFYDLTQVPWVVNLPQYVNPKFDDAKNKSATKDHGGENSLSYRVFVKGEVVEEGISVFDMARVRLTYNENKHVKFFEINKKNLHNFKTIIVAEPTKQAKSTYLCCDIGESAPSEIIILFEVPSPTGETIYKYSYNITLYNLTDKEQTQVISWLAKTVQATFIGLDTTDGTGRAIYRSLAEQFPKENMVWVGFNEKLPIDFERDENNILVFKDGVPTYKEEYVSEWSVKRLKDVFYDRRMEVPLDYKFDVQFNSVIAIQKGGRVSYECITDNGDHLFAAFRVFSIAQWLHEFSNARPISSKRFAKIGV